MRNLAEKILYSFPVQLLFVHVRKNLILILIWALFIALISGNFGRIYGVHFLFLDPEYLNVVGLRSFFLVGVAFGTLVMSFNITCYILDGHQFSFVGILERPFTKFSINNAVIPIVSLTLYVFFIIRFQLQNEYSSFLQLIVNLIGLSLGIVAVLSFFLYYFKWTNKDIFKYLAGSVDKRLKKSNINRGRVLSKLKESREVNYEVHGYLDHRLRWRDCKNLQNFYDKEAVLKVFDQNHFNSVVIDLAIILIILLLGFFMDFEILQIPAAASVLLMMSILIMLTGAITYWFRGWSYVFVIGIFLVVNFLMRIGFLKGIYYAKGLDYTKEPVAYSLNQLQELSEEGTVQADSVSMINVMNQWRSHQDSINPKMVFLCVSGGGQRAALWTLTGLVKADSVLKGSLMKKTMLITGASGGMIGASYYRELVLKGLPTDDSVLGKMGKDNLNPIIFSLLVNDAFFRLHQFQYAGMNYLNDRGYVFEENLNNNLENAFDKRVIEYRPLEQSAQIPTVLMAPVIANDGRSLYISSLPMSFMNLGTNDNGELTVRGVGMHQLFSDHGFENLDFLTTLRMSASFPYITPTISLPSEPVIEIMDAGISDNFGISDAVHFISYFEEWIEKNTGGVVFLIVRDSRKSAPIEPQTNSSITGRLTHPIASVYNNLANIQDINNDDNLSQLKNSVGFSIETVSIEYNTYSNIDQEYLLPIKELERKEIERASLSWHLTTKQSRKS